MHFLVLSIIILRISRLQFEIANSIESGQTTWVCKLADQFKVFILISLKMIMDSAKHWRWIIPFKKFGMVRVKSFTLLQVQEKLLHQTVNIINRDSIMSSYDYLSRCKNFVWAFLVVPFYWMIYCTANSSMVLNITKRGRGPDLSHSQIGMMCVILMPVSFVLFQIMICFLPTCCYRQNVSSRY